jgi:hypothetical protein
MKYNDNTQIHKAKKKLSPEHKKLRKLFFILTGFLSTLWIIIRVIPKPQRATYPCVKASAPWASAFIVYLLGLSGSFLSFKKFKQALKTAKYPVSIGLLILAVLFASISLRYVPSETIASVLSGPALGANTPIGVAKGIFPGRVVWIHDADATNENFTNTLGDYWFQDTDQHVVDGMLNSGIKNIAGDTNIFQAWNLIFSYFNKSHDKGSIGYSKGEKIYVKINLTNSCCCSWNNNTEKISSLEHMDATPQLCHALLDQLVNIVGVEQPDIYLGDPFRRFHDIYWDMLHADFPDVHYMDGNGFNGRKKTTLTAQEILVFSDGKNSSRIPREYVDASYFINMPCLKTHDQGGITLTAKNHQGSVIEWGKDPEAQSALFMHYSLPANNPGYKKYRHLVDYMGHEQLGGKTLLYIVDGIWAGKNWDGTIEKWNMPPFSGDYPSSLFVSLDPVAIESVCYDFMLEEYKNKGESEKYPYMEGTDDYLLQAADKAYWPSGIIYDPEGDGSKIGSLGVYEHWNNAMDKQYSVNLGSGNGIELVSAGADYNFEFTGTSSRQNEMSLKIYPQPARNFLCIQFPGQMRKLNSFSISDMNGKIIVNKPVVSAESQLSLDVSGIPSGTYIIHLTVSDGSLYNSIITIQ